MNATFIGCAAFGLLMSFLLLSGGSSRPDAASQNIYALTLALSFGMGAAYVGWSAYGRIVSWKDDRVRLRNVTGGERSYELARARSIVKVEITGEYKIVFDDGSRPCFSAYLHGADELATNVLHRLPSS